MKWSKGSGYRLRWPLVWLLAGALCICGLSRLFAQTSSDSPTTTPPSPPPSLTPLENLLQADATLTQLVAQAQLQSALVASQSVDLLQLSGQLALSEANSATLERQLTDSQTALGLSQAELQKSNDSLDSLKVSYDALSASFKAASDAADKLARDSADSLKAERAQLLPWKIAGFTGGAVGVATLVYWIGHALKAW